jgi:hypothetical protein
MPTIFFIEFFSLMLRKAKINPSVDNNPSTNTSKPINKENTSEPEGVLISEKIIKINSNTNSIIPNLKDLRELVFAFFIVNN